MGFLADLAGMARGVKPAGAARISLPSRFAEANPPVGETFGEITDASPTAPAIRQPSSDTMRSNESTPTSIRPWGPKERQDEPAVAIPSRSIPPASQSLPTQGAARTTSGAVEPAPAPARRLPQGVRGERPADIPVRPEAGVPPSSRPLRRSAEATLPAVRSPTEGRQRAPATATPLSDVAVAGRAHAPREERPVIHVTIDRLEVRAPAVPKAAVERPKSRPLPSQSLADYLRGDAGGGRR
jgi:hypothetical protein